MKVEKSSLTVQVNKERDPYDLVTKRMISIKDKKISTTEKYDFTVFK
ncbi:hypothetical protein [Peribacillus phoenicis]